MNQDDGSWDPRLRTKRQKDERDPTVAAPKNLTADGPKVRDREKKSSAIESAQTEAEDLYFEGDEDDFEDETVYEDTGESTGEETGYVTEDESDSNDCEKIDLNAPMSIPSSPSAIRSERNRTSDKNNTKQRTQAWMPGKPLEAGESLDYDVKAYDMIHHFELGWSCLSFDVLPDPLGSNQNAYPQTVYVVAGTQANRLESNSIFAVKLSDLYKTNRDAGSSCSSSDSSESDTEELDEDEENYRATPPTLRYSSYPHTGTVNKIRLCSQIPRLAAAWSETGEVAVWDLQPIFSRLENVITDVTPIRSAKPLYSVTTHGGKEGFALDWDPLTSGRFATGAQDGLIIIYNPVEGGWNVDRAPFKGHSASVEDVAWKKRGEGAGNVIVSASADASLRLWDVRVDSRKAVAQMPNAHEGDVNVAVWCPTADEMLLSGGDDGVCSCWDMRAFETPLAIVAKIKFHQKPITSVDWHPTDQGMFATASLDDTVAIWDMSVEPDEAPPEIDNLSQTEQQHPDQLMFLHCGQRHIAEIKWHPMISGMLLSTAEDGFHVFKAQNID